MNDRDTLIGAITTELRAQLDGERMAKLRVAALADNLLAAGWRRPAARIPRLLTPEEVGELLGVTPQALAQMRYFGTGPSFHKLSAKTVRYSESTVEEWVESCTRTRTSDGS